MSLNHRFTTVFVAAVSSVIGASVVGCEGAAGPCDTDFDCGANFTCDDGTCTPKTGGGGGGGGNEGEGEGEGEAPPELVQLDNPVSMFIPGTDIGDPATIALVGEYQGNGVDQVRRFDVVTGVIETAPAFDFVDNSIGEGGGCNIDAMSIERGIDPTDLRDELWFSCQNSGLESSLTDDQRNDIAVRTGVGADLIVRFDTPELANPDIIARRMYARRGTSTLTIEQVQQDFTNRPQLRNIDDVAVDFGAIAGLFRVTETDEENFGDIVLVFDRAYPGADGKPALVPIERSPFASTDTWIAAHTPWVVIPLPDDTHAVRVGSIPDPNQLAINEVDQATQNLAVFLPTEGVVGFGRLESIMTTPGQSIAADGTGSGFNPLLFDTDVPNAAPNPELRILLTDVPGAADTVFYVLRGAVRSYGWKMKLHVGVNDDFTNDVERARFLDESRDDPNGIVTIPGVDDAAWISLKSDTVLERLPFDVAF